MRSNASALLASQQMDLSTSHAVGVVPETLCHPQTNASELVHGQSVNFLEGAEAWRHLQYGFEGYRRRAVHD
jgi:hypothetical protein